MKPRCMVRSNSSRSAKAEAPAPGTERGSREEPLVSSAMAAARVVPRLAAPRCLDSAHSTAASGKARRSRGPCAPRERPQPHRCRVQAACQQAARRPGWNVAQGFGCDACGGHSPWRRRAPALLLGPAAPTHRDTGPPPARPPPPEPRSTPPAAACRPPRTDASCRGRERRRVRLPGMERGGGPTAAGCGLPGQKKARSVDMQACILCLDWEMRHPGTHVDTPLGGHSPCHLPLLRRGQLLPQLRQAPRKGGAHVEGQRDQAVLRVRCRCGQVLRGGAAGRPEVYSRPERGPLHIACRQVGSASR